MAERIQLRRTKGWRLPDGAVNVARPRWWGNPYKVLRVDRPGFYPYGWRVRPEPAVALVRHIWPTETAAAERAVALYRKNLIERIAHGSVDVTELAGRDLACWCPLAGPCHADLLIEIANTEEKTDA